MRLFLFLILALVCSGCAGVPFIPTEARDTLSHPTHVEAFRTGTLDAHPGYGGKMDGFAVFGTGAASEEVAGELAGAVMDPQSYIDAPGPADFVPTVGYRFYRKLDHGLGQMSVDVLIGFDHDQMLLVARDNKLREDFRRMLEFAPIRDVLVHLSQEAFPEDKTVQSLIP